MTSTKTCGARSAAALATAAGALLAVAPAAAADHRDGAAVQEVEGGAADITDVFAWMRGSNVVLAMNVQRDAGASALFSDAVQYAFHVGRHAQFPLPATRTVDVVCTFDEAQMIQCWIGDEAYVTGDASAEDGIATPSGDVRVFAGVRQDPFFFYETGFRSAREYLVPLMPLLHNGVTAESGCPQPEPVFWDAIHDELIADGPTQNDFRDENVLAIVIELDAAYLVDAGAPLLSVWGSTHLTPG